MMLTLRMSMSLSPSGPKFTPSELRVVTNFHLKSWVRPSDGDSNRLTARTEVTSLTDIPRASSKPKKCLKWLPLSQRKRWLKTLITQMKMLKSLSHQWKLPWMKRATPSLTNGPCSSRSTFTLTLSFIWEEKTRLSSEHKKLKPLPTRIRPLLRARYAKLTSPESLRG